MGKSSRLRLSEVRAVFQLVQECRELWADPAAWRQHLVAGAGRLTGMKVVQYAEAAIGSFGVAPRILCNTVTGFPQCSDLTVYQAARAAYPDKFDFFLGSKSLLGIQPTGKPAAGLREELCNDRRWYLSAVYNEYRRPVCSDGNVISVVQREPGLVTVLDVNQCFDDPRPSVRTKRTLMLLHESIESLVGEELVADHQRGLQGLTSQQRITLERLLAGDSEKQIAAKMGIRQPTVHEYVGKLYRHFDVRSRAELMAYFIRRKPRPR